MAQRGGDGELNLGSGEFSHRPEGISGESFREILGAQMEKATEGHQGWLGRRVSPVNPRGTISTPEDWIEAVVHHQANKALRVLDSSCELEISNAPGGLGGKKPPRDLAKARAQMGKLRHAGRPSAEVQDDGLITYDQMLEFEKGLWHVHLACVQSLVITEARIERHGWRKADDGGATARGKPGSASTHRHRRAHSAHHTGRADVVPAPPPGPRGGRYSHTGDFAQRTRKDLHVDLSQLQRRDRDAPLSVGSARSCTEESGGAQSPDGHSASGSNRQGPGMVPLLDLKRMDSEEEDEEDLDDVPLDAGWNSRPGKFQESHGAGLHVQLSALNRRSEHEHDPGATTHRGARPHSPKPGAQGGKYEEEEELYTETESARKLKKMRFFSGQCSRVLGHVFVSGDKVAQNRQMLLENGINVVLNCVGTVLHCHHREDPTIKYCTLPLLDSESEQISRYFYNVLSLMEDCERDGQHLLVHCHQGVSRSCTFVIAYLMWKQGLTYDQAFQSLREARGIGHPNLGFMCQLIAWDKRRYARLNRSAIPPSVYVCFSSDADAYDSFPGAAWLVDKPDSLVLQNDPMNGLLLAEEACVVVQTNHEVLLRKGLNCSKTVINSALKHCQHLMQFEGAPQCQEVDSTNEKFMSILKESGFKLES